MLCLIGFCAEPLNADLYAEMAEPHFSVANELFKPKVTMKSSLIIKNQYDRPAIMTGSFVQKEKYMYKTIGAGVLSKGQTVASSGRVNENEYRAQIPVMSSFGMGEPMMQEMMLMASPPPGGGPGTAELVSIDDEIPVLLLLLVGYCFWVWQRRKVYSK